MTGPRTSPEAGGYRSAYPALVVHAVTTLAFVVTRSAMVPIALHANDTRPPSRAEW